MKRNHFTAILSMCMIPLAGCVGPSSGNDDGMVENMSGAEPLIGTSELSIERSAGAKDFKMLGSIEGWREVQPGVWEGGAGDNKQQIVVGAEGHKWLAEQTGEQLKALRAQLGDGANQALAEKLSQTQNLYEQAKEVELSERAEAVSPTAVSCSFAPYIGRLSAITSPPTSGGAALVRIVCTGGSVTFTVLSTVCCSGACTGGQQTVTVGSTAVTVGSTRAGTGAGNGMVGITRPPPVMTWGGAFTCG
jgi:hypothetical protein